MIKKLGSILAAVLVVCLLVSLAAKASPQPRVIYTGSKTTKLYISANYAKAAQRPAGISGYVAVHHVVDGTTTLEQVWLPIALRDVHWSSWGATAEGSGTLYAPPVTSVTVCVPRLYCVIGSYVDTTSDFKTPCKSFTSSNVCVLPKGYALPKVGSTAVTAQALLTHKGQQFYDELNVALPAYPGDEAFGTYCELEWQSPWIYSGTVGNYEASTVAGETTWTVGPSTVCGVNEPTATPTP
jgi:hypothetical protein